MATFLDYTSTGSQFRTELGTSEQIANCISLLAADVNDDPFMVATQVYESQPTCSDSQNLRTYVFDNYMADLQHRPRDDFVSRLVSLQWR